ncbi:50S ribosomal protein L2, partial [Candidatus Bathyarchaeota archaeon]
MGKRILVQRRGRGSPTFRANTHRRVAPARYPALDSTWSGAGVLKGLVRELVHDPGRGAPLALIELEDGREFYTVAVEGMYEGQIIEYGPGASNAIGNIAPVGAIPEGTLICNVELRPGDGGKLARSSGAYATVLAHTHEGTMIK